MPRKEEIPDREREGGMPHEGRGVSGTDRLRIRRRGAKGQEENADREAREGEGWGGEAVGGLDSGGWGETGRPFGDEKTRFPRRLTAAPRTPTMLASPAERDGEEEKGSEGDKFTSTCKTGQEWSEAAANIAKSRQSRE